MGDVAQLTEGPVRVPAAAGGTNGKVVSDPKEMPDVSAYSEVNLEVRVIGGSGTVGTLTLYSAMSQPKSLDDAIVVLAAVNLTGASKTIVKAPDSGQALLRYLGWKIENSTAGDIYVSLSGIARRDG